MKFYEQKRDESEDFPIFRLVDQIRLLFSVQPNKDDHFSLFL